MHETPNNGCGKKPALWEFLWDKIQPDPFSSNTEEVANC